MMFEKSFLKTTGQMWKIYLFFVGFEVAGLGLIFLSLNGTAEDDISAVLAMVGLGLAISGFVLGVLTVRCPKCKTHLLWKAVKEQPFQSWLLWLSKLTSCPACAIGNR